jgi:hypothetical protein
VPVGSLSTSLVYQSNGFVMSEASALESIFARIKSAEERLARLEEKIDNPVERVKRDLLSKDVFSYSLVTVPDNYYTVSLSQRAKILNATVPQLCKSIIFENTVSYIQ